MSKHLQLSDGRSLAWHEFGVATGRPVLFCTGAGMSGALAFGEGDLKRLGLRLISIDRPGLGRSDAHPAKTLDSWCRDVAALVKALGLRELPLAVAFSQGAPFAFALANVGLVGALAIVSGQDDFADPRVFSLLPPPVAEFVGRVQARDEALLADLRQTADAEGFLQLILSMSSEKDRQLYGTEPFRSGYQACLADGFRQGADGYVRDLVNALGRWPFQLERISVPVDFWYGALDANATHSPDFAATTSQRLPCHTRTVLADEGGSLLWTRSGEILEALARHGEREVRVGDS